MKRTILFLTLAASLAAQTPTNVQKGGAAGTNNITADLNIGTGRTFTIASGGIETVASGATFNLLSGGTFNVGTTTPATISGNNGAFTITAGAAGGNITLAPGASGFLLISSPGSVGTGTTAPATEWQIVSTSTSSERGIMSSQYNTGTNAAQFISRKARGSFATPSTVSSGDLLGSWIGEGYDGSSYLQMAAIQFNATGTIAATRVPTTISFYTGTNAAPSVETLAMTIDETQALVGSPAAGLTFKSGATFNNIIANTQNGKFSVSDATLTNSNVFIEVGLQNTTSNLSIISSSNGATQGFRVSTGANNTPILISPSGVGEPRVFFNGTQMITVTAASSSGIRFNQYTTAGTLKTDSSGNVSVAAAGQIPGTATNDNASAGNVGEFTSSTVATPGTSLSTGTTANVTSMTLTAGDWDVTGVVDYVANAATIVTALRQGSSSTSATLGAQDTFSTDDIGATVGSDPANVIPTTRFSLAGSTTVYLVAKADFSVNTLSGYGTLRARRAR